MATPKSNMIASIIGRLSNDKKLELVDKVLTAHGQNIVINVTDNGYTVSGLDDDFGMLNMELSQNGKDLDLFIESALNKALRGMNCPDSATTIICSLLAD